MRLPIKKIRFVLVVSTVLFSNGYSQNSESEREEVLQRARTMTKEFLSTYKSILLTSMAQRGASGAIAVCADTAQNIAHTMGKNHHALLKRVGTRLRNPMNAPDAYEDSVLTVFSQQLSSGAMNESTEHLSFQRTDSGIVARYMKPITVQPVCQSCHGTEETISNNISTLLKKRYPHDRATGYAVGDLRGAVSLIIPLR